VHQPPSGDDPSRIPATSLGWYRFSWFASLLGLLWLALAGLMVIDLSGTPDPYVVANLQFWIVPSIVIGLATLALQVRAIWLSLVGILGIVAGGSYVLTTIGFLHYGSPLPAPSFLKATSLGVFLAASITAIGVGLASSRSPIGRFIVVLLLIPLVLLSLVPLSLIIGVGR
jgi:hypothetical protein